MSDDPLDLRRQVVQRLESLRRAGIDRIPRPAFGGASKVPPTLPHKTPSIASPSPSRVEKAPAPLSGSLFEPAQPSEPEVPESERPSRLASLAAEVAACERCPVLAAHRTQTVFGEGSPTARLMFIGEGPGADEDRTGRPFVGKAGMLLTDMITKGMGLTREEVYIANIVKSRPINLDPNRTSDNRPPTPEEISHCLPFLERQIAIIRPQFLCLLGKTPASTLLETSLPMGRLRGKWHEYRGIPTIVTWHPSYLLRMPTAKKDTWEDLQMLMKRMGIKPKDRNNAKE